MDGEWIQSIRYKFIKTRFFRWRFIRTHPNFDTETKGTQFTSARVVVWCRKIGVFSMVNLEDKLPKHVCYFGPKNVHICLCLWSASLTKMIGQKLFNTQTITPKLQKVNQFIILIYASLVKLILTLLKVLPNLYINPYHMFSRMKSHT